MAAPDAFVDDTAQPLAPHAEPGDHGSPSRRGSHPHNHPSADRRASPSPLGPQHPRTTPDMTPHHIQQTTKDRASGPT